MNDRAPLEQTPALPGAVKVHVLRSIWDVLTGHDTSADLAHLSTSDPKINMEILQAIRPILSG